MEVRISADQFLGALCFAREWGGYALTSTFGWMEVRYFDFVSGEAEYMPFEASGYQRYRDATR